MLVIIIFSLFRFGWQKNFRKMLLKYIEISVDSYLSLRTNIILRKEKFHKRKKKLTNGSIIVNWPILNWTFMIF